MPYFTYDTSVIISRKILALHAMPKNFLMSAVVLMELTASAQDASRRKSFERAFRQFEQNGLLIVPSAEDWLLASKIIFLLTESRRREGRGKLKRLPPGASQRLALDVLIAVSARRWNAQVVTENGADFKSDSALLQHDHHQSSTILQALVIRQDLIRFEAHLAETLARLFYHFARTADERDWRR
jgi:predicted nucleic acid-binding protein